LINERANSRCTITSSFTANVEEDGTVGTRAVESVVNPVSLRPGSAIKRVKMINELSIESELFSGTWHIKVLGGGCLKEDDQATSKENRLESGGHIFNNIFLLKERKIKFLFLEICKGLLEY